MSTPSSSREDICREALDTLPEAVLVYDNERVLYANAEAAVLLRASDREDLIGLDLREFMLPGLTDIQEARRTYVLKDGLELHDVFVKVRGLDGEPVVLRVNIKPVQFDGAVAAVTTLAK